MCKKNIEISSNCEWFNQLGNRLPATVVVAGVRTGGNFRIPFRLLRLGEALVFFLL